MSEAPHNKELHQELIGLSNRMLRLISPEATHQHYKGGLYKVTCVHENGMTYYTHCFPHEAGLYERDTEEFSEEVLPGVRRFRPLF